MKMVHKTENRPVLLFDGDCNLCNKSVRFVMRHEKYPKIVFASLQSDYAAKLLDDVQAVSPLPDSIVLFENDKILLRSDAALRIAILMGGWTKIFAVFYLIPRFLRDAVYNFVASNRKKIFGTSEHCALLPGADKSRFLDFHEGI
ncbi:MAG: DCC1-like thiol-disulfide oxidoreductase family protein [Bacteroidales bacterium]|nr:DCC1-like thiol-disulfide oxidoreductase family protein [Bacteroidales bacterium]